MPVAPWCAEARERGNPRRLASVAAAAVGGALAHAVLARVTAALAVDARAWDLGADALTVHRAPEGHLDRVAVRPPAWVVAGDPAAPAAPQTSTSVPPVSPAAPSPDAPSPARAAAPSRTRPRRTRRRRTRRSPDAPSPAAPCGGPPRWRRTRSSGCTPTRPRCSTRVAAAAVATLAPLLDEVRAATRFGLVPLWNAAGDAVRLTAAMVPRYAGRTPRPELAAALLDALVAHGAPIRGRGTDQPLARTSGAGAGAGRLLPRLPDRPAGRPTPPTPCAPPAPCSTPRERARRYAAWLMTACAVQAGR